MGIAKKIAMFVLVGFALALATAAFSIFLTGKQHQAAAIAFWGDLYQPTENRMMDFGLIGNMFLPAGGPLLDTEFSEACEDTPLPMVPVRIGPYRAVEVLCGLGKDASVRTVSFQGEGRKMLEDSIFEIFDSEH